MEVDVKARFGARYHENNPERLNSSNGCQDRPWDTRDTG